MKGFCKGLLAFAILLCLCFTIIPQSSAQVGSLTRRLIGIEDLALATGGTGAVETFTYVDPSHNILTLHKLDASYIKFRTAQGGLSKSIEALVDGTQTIDLMPNDLNVGGDLSVAGTTTLTGATGITGLTTFGAIPVGPASDPTSNNQFTRKYYVDTQVTAAIATAEAASVLLAGNQTVAGVKSFSSFPVTPSSAPTTDYQMANKKYVDDSLVRNYAILQNRQTKNTAGGSSSTGSWEIIPLNTEYEDASAFVTTTSLPAFSLPAGTYQIDASCPFYLSSKSQVRLYNVTDNAVQTNVNGKAMLGSTAYGANAGTSVVESSLYGTFTITGIKQFRIEYTVTDARATDGLGLPGNIDEEVYAQIRITKVQ